MNINLQVALSDPHIPVQQQNSQRQLSISVRATETKSMAHLPLNICLVLDRSGSMQGKPITIVKQAAINLVEKLNKNDRLSLIAFNHEAKVIIPNQKVQDIKGIKDQIQQLKADGGTAIDEGMKLALAEIAKGKDQSISQILLLTDGENEHGDNQRCLNLASLAAEHNITFNALGFGHHWNQDVLEKIADSANGNLSYIEQPEQAMAQFEQLLTRIQSVSLTNAYLWLELMPNVRLAELKPIAQVAPETIELEVKLETNNSYSVRLGDVMTQPREILANLYLSHLAPGQQTIAKVQVRYNDPALGTTDLFSEKLPVTVEVQQQYQSKTNLEVQKSILTLAKYRQTQMAETKLQQGDRQSAATMLQSAAKTALQLGDKQAATILQTNATLLQTGKDLSEADRKKTRIVSKTILQE